TDWIYRHFKKSVELEIEWSSYVLADLEGIDLVEMAGYVKYRANKMLRMMGLSEIYPEHVDNPMKWIRADVDNFDGTKTDFFEQKSRQYTKTSDLNGFDDLYEASLKVKSLSCRGTFLYHLYASLLV